MGNGKIVRVGMVVCPLISEDGFRLTVSLVLHSYIFSPAVMAMERRFSSGGTGQA